MLEPVGALTGDRRAQVAENKLPPEEIVDRGVHVAHLSSEVGDRSRPEDAPDDGGALEQSLLPERQPVDARGDQRLHGVGDPLHRAVAAFLEQHPDGLLEEERVPAGLLEQVRANGRGEIPAGKECVDQLGALDAVERVQLDGGRPHAAPAPPGPVLEQLRAAET